MFFCLHLVRGIDQHPHAVDADDGDQGQADDPEDEAGVADGHGQSQDADTDVALQNVNDGLEVAEERKHQK